MSHSPVALRYRLLADGIAATSVLLVIVAFVAHRIAYPHGAVAQALIVDSSFVFGFAGAGWLIARHRPRNPIGWCFSLGGLAWALPTSAWAELALTGHVPVNVFARLCAMLAGFGWILAMPLSIQIPLLLLPDGRLLSRRWRAALWLVGAGFLIGPLGFSTIPGQIDDIPGPDRHLVNPLGIRALGPVPEALAILGAGLLVVGMVLGAVAVVVRFRRSRGIERQQMRWVALGGCLLLTAPVTGITPGIPQAVGGPVGTVGIIAVPVCVAVAVLRYKLYDLGRIISRTVSYGVITTVLIGVYVSLVTLAAAVFGGTSSLTVAAATLAAAALFQPLRRRVQSVVNHRFNRSGYDAERTVEDFNRRLRSEVDLATVRADLLTVVQRTMQPEHAQLWLRPQSAER